MQMLWQMLRRRKRSQSSSSHGEHWGFGEGLASQTSSSAIDVVESFSILRRTRLNYNKLSNISELELECELSNNPQLLNTIKEYVRISIDTEKLFSSIDKCVKAAKSSGNILLEMVMLFDEGGERNSSVVMVEVLKKFKANDNTFPQIVDKFRSSCNDHISRVQTLS